MYFKTKVIPPIQIFLPKQRTELLVLKKKVFPVQRH